MAGEGFFCEGCQVEDWYREVGEVVGVGERRWEERAVCWRCKRVLGVFSTWGGVREFVHEG
jgi:hypothetical protein